MKNAVKIIYLLILLIIVEISVMILTDFRRTIPSNFNDVSDVVLSDLYNYEVSGLQRTDNGWTIVGIDPNIAIKGISKYINGIEIQLLNQQDKLHIVVYYNTGKGFNQGEIIGASYQGDGIYFVKLIGNIYEIRIDVEGAAEGTFVSDMNVTIHNGHAYFIKMFKRFIIINLLLFLLCVVGIIIEILIKKSTLKLATAKAIICALFIGISEKAYMRLPTKLMIVLSLINLMVILTCLFLDLKNVEEE